MWGTRIQGQDVGHQDLKGQDVGHQDRTGGMWGSQDSREGCVAARRKKAKIMLDENGA